MRSKNVTVSSPTGGVLDAVMLDSLPCFVGNRCYTGETNYQVPVQSTTSKYREFN